MYGVGTGAITMSNVVCSGLERKIINCRYNTDTSGILNHNNDAQVQCQKGLFIAKCFQWFFGTFSSTYRKWDERMGCSTGWWKLLVGRSC